MSIHVKVITSPDCPFSPEAISFVQFALGKHKGILVEEVSMVTELGKEFAGAHQITSTPAITINNILTFEGIPTKKELMGAINDEKYREKERCSAYL